MKKNPAKTGWLVKIGIQRLSAKPPHELLYAAACERPDDAIAAVMAKLNAMDETFEIVRKLNQKELSELKLSEHEVCPYDR